DPDERARHRLSGHLPVPLGVERPASCSHLLRPEHPEPPDDGAPRVVGELAWWGVALPHCGRIHPDGASGDGVSAPAALLRQWAPRRLRQGLKEYLVLGTWYLDQFP